MFEYCIDRSNALEIFSRSLSLLPSETMEGKVCNKDFKGMCIHYLYGKCTYDPKECKRGESKE